MIARGILDRLATIVGEGGFAEHAPIEVGGVSLAVTLRPGDGEALSRSLDALSACGMAALIRGGGNRLGVGNLASRGDAFLSTERMSGVDEFEPGEGVCHVRAGTRLADAREVVRAGGWEFPLDAPGDTATCGGVLAAAAVGPRALGFGRPRDLVLGLEVTLATGERTRCGGRVVKNVTGYDLNKLYTGSFGSLGVIEGAWLRLRPLPEQTSVFRAEASNLEGMCARGLAAARCSSARAVAIDVEMRGSQRAVELVVELAGDAATVEADAVLLQEQGETEPAAAGALDRIRRRQERATSSSGLPFLRFCIDVLPSRMEVALAKLCERCTGVLVYPGLGLLYAELDLVRGDASEVEMSFYFIEVIARNAGGGWRCESAPKSVKAGRDVFDTSPETLAVSRDLKRRFDPGGVLNPGRFAGRI